MPWYGEHTKTAKWNTIDFWTNSLSHPDVITLDDLPENLYVSVKKTALDTFRICSENQQIHIQSSLPDEYRIYIYDLTGKLHVYKNNLKGNQTISVSGTNEMYFLLTLERNNIRQTHKIKINYP
jgi:hypothetical protein